MLVSLSNSPTPGIDTRAIFALLLLIFLFSGERLTLSAK